MPPKRSIKICAVTGTRADWGLLLPLLRAIKKDRRFNLKLIATGQHLMKGAGNTRRAIKDDGFKIDALVDMKISGDTPATISKSLGLAIGQFGKVLAKMKPDLLFVLGDRYEILGAVTAATLARIPIVHNFGGDITEGAVDDVLRHAMTKMSHVHFVTNAAARRRVCQMGESPKRVFDVGSSGIDLVKATPLMKRAELFKSVGLKPGKKNIVVTFHPETLEPKTESHCREMLRALGRLGVEVGLLFTGTNADMEGRSIGRLIARFVKTHPNAVLHPSLGARRYFSALKHGDAVVGNSSSGVYEAPSFHTPTVNIGDRQKGRLRAKSVIDVAPNARAIYQAIRRAFKMDCSSVKNPYGDGRAAEKTMTALTKVLDGVGWDARRLLRKTFVERPAR
jgi:UDP-hydrolysing UDP-N-acetyl-D-glucosamine 2-epimerase